VKPIAPRGCTNAISTAVQDVNSPIYSLSAALHCVAQSAIGAGYVGLEDIEALSADGFIPRDARDLFGRLVKRGIPVPFISFGTGVAKVGSSARIKNGQMGKGEAK
jgi:hypothetical protein